MVLLDQTLGRGVTRGVGAVLILAATGAVALAQPLTQPPTQPPTQALAPPADASRKPALRAAPEPVCRLVTKTRIVKVPRMILKNGLVFGTVDRPADEKVLACQPAA